MIIVELEVVVGFDLGVDRTCFGDSEPKFDFITDCIALFSRESGLDVDSAAGTLGVQLHSSEFVMHKVVTDDGVGLTGEVCPRFNLNGFRL